MRCAPLCANAERTSAHDAVAAQPAIAADAAVQREEAIVGCSVIDQWRLEHVKNRKSVNIPVRYFSDPEQAKTWLVSEGF